MFAKDTKILVADDMVTMRRIIKESLKDLGYTNIVDAKNGEMGWEALEAADAEQDPIQLVVSDWNMPAVSGLELLEKVRSDARFAKLPFIMLTAKSDQNDLQQAEGHGVDAYMTKPFSTEELENTLATVSDKRAA